jgi:hypothetical protein
LNDWGASYFALEAKPPVVKQIWLSHLPINLTSGDDCSPPYRVLGSMKRLAALRRSSAAFEEVRTCAGGRRRPGATQMTRSRLAYALNIGSHKSSVIRRNAIVQRAEHHLRRRSVQLLVGLS